MSDFDLDPDADVDATLPDDAHRPQARVTDDGDILPPTVDTRDVDAPEAIIEAVNAALADHPNAAIDVLLSEPTHGAVVDVAANFQELPHVDENGALKGWLPPYRAREKFEAALGEHLDGYHYEAANESRFNIYEGDR